MLVLSRKATQRILIGDNIAVTVVRVGNGAVRLGIEAPKEMKVIRDELEAAANAVEGEQGHGG